MVFGWIKGCTKWYNNTSITYYIRVFGRDVLFCHRFSSFYSLSPTCPSTWCIAPADKWNKTSGCIAFQFLLQLKFPPILHPRSLSILVRYPPDDTRSWLSTHPSPAQLPKSLSSKSYLEWLKPKQISSFSSLKILFLAPQGLILTINYDKRRISSHSRACRCISSPQISLSCPKTGHRAFMRKRKAKFGETV